MNRTLDRSLGNGLQKRINDCASHLARWAWGTNGKNLWVVLGQGSGKNALCPSYWIVWRMTIAEGIDPNTIELAIEEDGQANLSGPRLDAEDSQWRVERGRDDRCCWRRQADLVSGFCRWRRAWRSNAIL